LIILKTQKCNKVFIEALHPSFLSRTIRSAENLKIDEVFRTETEFKIRNEIERKMQDIQPNVEK
jgi:phosphoribosylpyrophosphate synthetase